MNQLILDCSYNVGKHICTIHKTPPQNLIEKFGEECYTALIGYMILYFYFGAAVEMEDDAVEIPEN